MKTKGNNPHAQFEGIKFIKITDSSLAFKKVQLHVQYHLSTETEYWH